MPRFRFCAVVWFCELLHAFPTELRTIWWRPLSGGSMLFIVNRYSTLLYQVLALLFNMPGSHATNER